MTPPRWFRGCVTAWGIHVVIYLWQIGEWRQITKDTSAA